MNVVDHIRADAEAGARRLEREYKDRLLTVAKRLCPDAVEAEALVWRTFDEGGKIAGMAEKADGVRIDIKMMLMYNWRHYDKDTDTVA